MTKWLLSWTNEAWKDYLYWQRQDKKTLKRINTLIEATLRDPFGGIGKPEALKENLSGFHSRRIDQMHRLVYAVEEKEIVIISCKASLLIYPGNPSTLGLNSHLK